MIDYTGQQFGSFMVERLANVTDVYCRQDKSRKITEWVSFNDNRGQGKECKFVGTHRYWYCVCCACSKVDIVRSDHLSEKTCRCQHYKPEQFSTPGPDIVYHRVSSESVFCPITIYCSFRVYSSFQLTSRTEYDMIVIMRNHCEYTHINSICRTQGTAGITERSQSGSRRYYSRQWLMKVRICDMLTKKDFKAVAEIIEKRKKLNRGTRLTSNFLYADDLAGDLADYFATQNPRFDRERFMKACGLG